MNRRNATVTAVFAVVIIALVAVMVSSCGISKQTPSKASEKSEAQCTTVTFPKETVIDDYDVRIVPDKVSYPTELPLLAAKREGFTEKEIIGWFTGERGKADRVARKDVIVPHPDGPMGLCRHRKSLIGPSSGRSPVRNSGCSSLLRMVGFHLVTRS